MSEVAVSETCDSVPVGASVAEKLREAEEEEKRSSEMNSSSDGQNFSVADFWLLSFMRQCLHFLS